MRQRINIFFNYYPKKNIYISTNNNNKKKKPYEDDTRDPFLYERKDDADTPKKIVGIGHPPGHP
jgi:hypothetical protein